MSTKSYDFEYLVFIGRFQPFHEGHKKVIEEALTLAEKVIVLTGSAFQPRTIKNPWTTEERNQMITGCFSHEENNRIVVRPLQDQAYNDQKWASQVQEHVDWVVARGGWRDKTRIGLIGHIKDESSFYLKMFPQWKLVEHEVIEMINATDLRALYFEQKNLKFLQSLVPVSTYAFLEQFRGTDSFTSLVKEYNHIQTYKKAWEAAPYKPTFVTVDAVVVQSGHVLLIQRKASPGAGLWAVPGGFVNQDEFLEDAVIRELKEETKLKVPVPVLKGSIKATKIFDHPNRSLRGRTITNAYLIELPAGELPAVKGSDDAKKAKWFPINAIKSEEMFEDHHSIIEYFLGQL